MAFFHLPNMKYSNTVEEALGTGRAMSAAV